MKLVMAAGVFWWVVIAVWLVRLGLGYDHASSDQIPPAIVGGVCGGLGAWYYGARAAKSRPAA